MSTHEAELSKSVTPPAKQQKTSRKRIAGLFREIWKYRLSYLFISPFVIAFILFILLPVLAAFGLSFTDFNTIQFPKFIGWDNYEYIFHRIPYF